MYSAGIPTFGTNIPVENGFINITNGNLHLEFPVATMAQRGNLSLNEKLVYDSRIWLIGHPNNYYWFPNNVPRTDQLAAGWRFVSGAETGSVNINNVSSQTACVGGAGAGDHFYRETYTYTWLDPLGTSHTFDALWTEFYSECNNNPYTESVGGFATDGSGYEISLSGSNDGSPTSIIIRSSNGTRVYPQVIDRYGNDWSVDGNGNLVDDLGRTPVIKTVSGNTIDFAVLTVGGNRVHYTVTTTLVSINTAFGEQAVSEWVGTLNAVQRIQLPDGTSYSFTYDSGQAQGIMEC